MPSFPGRRAAVALALAAALAAQAMSAPAIAAPSVAARSASAPRLKSWPGGVVAYRFDASVDGPNRALMRSCMDLWEGMTRVVRFIEKTESPLGRIPWALGLDRSLLIRDRGALDGIGRTTLGWGPRPLLEFNSAADRTDWKDAHFLHELGHVLGLLHEHQRRDRDAFVAFPPGFLASSAAKRADYEAYSDYPAPGEELPYDYASIMHYCSNVDGNYMTRRDTGAYILPLRLPSELDAEKIRRLY